MNIRQFAIPALALILTACNIGVSAPQDQPGLATSAAQTVEAALTSAVPLATATLEVPPITGAETPIPGVAIDGTTAEATFCEDTAQINAWERDFVIFDKAEAEKPIAPGTTFLINLQLQNTSPCLWTHQYMVKYDSGERLHTGPDTFPIMQSGFSVKPGETFPLSLQFTAPSKPGNYQSEYSLINADSKAFLFFGIPTTVGTPSTGNIAAPGDLRYEYSCVPGLVTITLKWKDKSDNEDGFRIYRDGTKVTDLAPGSTTYDDLLAAPGSYTYAVAAFNASGESPANVTAETTNCQ